jgi:hypothetical protein
VTAFLLAVFYSCWISFCFVLLRFHRSLFRDTSNSGEDGWLLYYWLRLTHAILPFFATMFVAELVYTLNDFAAWASAILLHAFSIIAVNWIRLKADDKMLKVLNAQDWKTVRSIVLYVAVVMSSLSGLLFLFFFAAPVHPTVWVVNIALLYAAIISARWLDLPFVRKKLRAFDVEATPLTDEILNIANYFSFYPRAVSVRPTRLKQESDQMSRFILSYTLRVWTKAVSPQQPVIPFFVAHHFEADTLTAVIARRFARRHQLVPFVGRIMDRYKITRVSPNMMVFFFLSLILTADFSLIEILPAGIGSAFSITGMVVIAILAAKISIGSFSHWKRSATQAFLAWSQVVSTERAEVSEFLFENARFGQVEGMIDDPEILLLGFRRYPPYQQLIWEAEEDAGQVWQKVFERLKQEPCPGMVLSSAPGDVHSQSVPAAQ